MKNGRVLLHVFSLLCLSMSAASCASIDSTVVPTSISIITSTVMPQPVVTPEATAKDAFPIQPTLITEALILLATQTSRTSQIPQGEDAISPYIFLESQDSSPLIKFDFLKNEKRPVTIGDEPVVHLFAWSLNGCELFVDTDHSNKAIYQLDADGGVKARFDFSEQVPDGKHFWMPYPSPNAINIAIIVGEGRLGLRNYEKQSILITSFRDPKKIRFLAENGGAFALSWSRDGASLAYTDFDETGNSQIYIANMRTGKIIQLTDWQSKDIVIQEISWSLDNAILFIHLFQPAEGKSEFGKINLEKLEDGYRSVVIEDMIFMFQYWFVDEKTIAAFIERNGQNEIILLDIQQQKIVGQILESQTPEGYVYLPGPFRTAGEFGFVSHAAFYAYDWRTKTFTKVFDLFSEIRDWHYLPSNKKCN